MTARLLAAGLLAMYAGHAAAETLLTVQPRMIADEKAVFATVESPNVVPARARIGGTIAALSVRDGDTVAPGQSIAVVGDDKILLQIGALEAQIAGLQSQVSQAQTDLARADTLFRQGSGTRVTLDQARTALEVASATLRARTAERAVLQQNLSEGEVLAPVAGRVLSVPLTRGSVVLPGDGVAMIAERRFLLRLRIPERHAVGLKAGDPVRLDAGQLGVGAQAGGTITLVYPRIDEGRVVADAQVAGLGDYFVGTRIRVWIAAGARDGFVVPAAFIATRSGIDEVRLRRGAQTMEISVQRGAVLADGVELLSGVRAGDVLVAP